MTIDAVRTALIAVDLMPRLVDQDMGPHRGADVVARAAELATALRDAGGTVVLVRVERPHVAEQPPGSGFVPELQPRDGDVVVVKRTIGAFYGTGLAETLRDRGIDTVVLTGLATTMGVESTARAAADHGFEVFFAADAMSGTTASEHDHALTVVLPRFGAVHPTSHLLALLAGDPS
ncbi:hydrolase [Actinoplanes philippinensis]|uniref:Nicotinamidase-related amidase n=1 Tax=Actinoplanes philippinensis TaxID=35752 RepID=A0A1I2ECX0_9ACTN|nr:isochorismatase family protein [Actinoplanes philippinensis]GIE77099.1 hydrolase [Actinoplanes philippinensis]SFE90517.1 Nicotinamidase-related amidase [Actinoplanes philippinensis]